MCIQYWQLIDKIVQQVALQTKDGNPDVAPLDVDIRKLLKQSVAFISLFLAVVQNLFTVVFIILVFLALSWRS